MKITKIKMTGYCDHFDYTVKDKGIFVVKKTRPTDIHGVYKATEAYEVELDMNDKEIKDLLNQFLRGRSYISTEEVVEYLSVKGSLPDEKLLLLNNSRTYNWLNSNGFLAEVASYISVPRVSNVKVIVFAVSDFKKCPPTKKEQEIIATLNNREKMQSLNNIVVADNIIKLLKNKGYEICREKANQWHDAFFFSDKKTFNALVKDAIEHYLNNIVLKELGCKIIVPKQKNSHCYKYDDVLCYVGDIKVDNINEGEHGE